MSEMYKRTGPLLITFILGLFTTFVYFLKVPTYISSASNTLTGWATIITALTAGLGAVYLLRYHVRRVQRQGTGWIYNLIIILSFFIFPILALSSGIQSSIFVLFYNNINRNIGVAVYGVVLFALTGGVYKAFRVRNINSLLLIISCFLVMLQIAPIGEVFWSGFPSLGLWVKDIPNTGAFRGLIIASAFGTLTVAFRTLLGYERGYLGGLEEE